MYNIIIRIMINDYVIHVTPRQMFSRSNYRENYPNPNILDRSRKLDPSRERSFERTNFHGGVIFSFRWCMRVSTRFWKWKGKGKKKKGSEKKEERKKRAKQRDERRKEEVGLRQREKLVSYDGA